MGSRAVASVREHPIPASIIGTGLAWLLLESMGVVSTGVGQSFGDSFTSARKSTRRNVRGAASSAAGSIGGAVKRGASAVGRGVSRGFTTSRDAVAHTIERHPLAACGALLAAGVAAGMMLPATRREGRLMGRRSAGLVEGVRRTGSDLLEQGKRLADVAVESVARGQRRASTGGGSRNRRSATAAR